MARMKLLPPEVMPRRKLLLAVADLHLRGFQRLRIMPYEGSVGAWRCVIAPASLIAADDGSWLASLEDESRLPRYSGANGFLFWNQQVSASTSPARIARIFLDAFPDVASQGYGPDWEYVGWYLHMLHLTYPDGLPLADMRGGPLAIYGREGSIPPAPLV
jgi:hypothetical protein